ncbi:hypothetical protein HDU97_001238 [Phlyctochytrium planicorne]|nr:hypothetical protein HDU97_001238 [Phlyctochytrium planicorne]
MAVFGLSPVEEGSIKKVVATTLLAKNSTTVWDAAASAGKSIQQHGFFHSVLWEKTHTLPPKKSVPPPSNRPVVTTHSILSPLNQNSALYPDGIMTPNWVKRHREEIPSVVVAFYDLHSASPEEKVVQPGIEREKDALMINEINEKRRSALDRGIKFAVILILSLPPPEIPNLEDRITFIRRGGSMDTKNSLFVLPPSSYATPNDINEFIGNVQRQLHEHAINYYREHGKRIKKKRAKLPAAPLRPPVMSPLGPPLSGSSTNLQSKPLNPMGWSVRYEYKSGVFAEFRQELETAIRHYEGAYQSLVDMFHSALSGGLFAPGGGGSSGSDVLVPFSPRWNEARILADSINLRICKLSLYTDAAVPALQQLHKHISNFRSLPEFAGIVTNLLDNFDPPTEGLGHLSNVAGGGSFDYWGWVSKQYRIFAELVKIATSKLGLKVPHPPPGSIPNATQNAAAATQSLLNTISNTSMNVITGGEVPVATFGPYSASAPYNVVQHAGYYYFIAARCAEERWRKVKEAEKGSGAGLTPLMPTAAAGPGNRSFGSSGFMTPLSSAQSSASLSAQSLTEQKRIDHGAVIIDLLTKSYEQFKAYRAGRMTLYLASEIARIYEASGKHEMSLTFFGRIKRTYRNENWPVIVRSILDISIRCAKRLSQRETVVECLVEKLSEWLTAEQSERIEVLNEVLEVLRGDETWATSVPRPSMLRVPMEMDQIHGFLKCSVQFRKVNGYVGFPAAFQVTLSGDGVASPPIPIKVSRIRVNFSHRSFDHVWVDAGEALDSGLQIKKPKYQWLDCTNVTKERDPDRFSPNSSISPMAKEFEERDVWLTKTDLEIVPGCRKVFESVVVPTESQDVKILMVTVAVETEKGVLYLNYRIGDRKEDTVSRRKWLAVETEARFLTLDGFGEQSSIRVIRRQPNLTMSLKHTPSGLLDEVYPITLEAVNEENEDIYAFASFEFRDTMSGDTLDATSKISLDAARLNKPEKIVQDSTIDLLASPFDETAPTGMINDYRLGVLAPGKTLTLPLFVRATKNTTERVLYATIIYRLSSELKAKGESQDTLAPPSTLVASSDTPDLFFRKNETLRISFGSAFEASFQTRRLPVSALPPTFPHKETGAKEDPHGLVGDHPALAGLLSDRFRDLETSRFENFGLIASIKAVATCDLEVGGIEMKALGTNAMDVNVRVDEASSAKDQSLGVWQTDNVFNLCFNVKTKRDVVSDVDTIDVGDLLLKWRRKQSGTDGEWFQSSINIPKIKLGKEDVWAFLHVPDPIYKGVPFTLEYIFQNTALNVAELSVHVEASESFVYSGMRRTSFRVLPLASYSLTYTCFPLVSGRCYLPRLRITKQAHGTGAGGGLLGAAANGSGSGSGLLAAGSVTSLAPDDNAAGGAEGEEVQVVASGAGQKDNALYVYIRPRVENVF